MLYLGGMVLSALNHYPFLLETLQLLRSYFEHVALEVEQIVALRILQIVDLLIVPYLQWFRPMLDFDQFKQSLSHSLPHFLPCLQRQVY